MKENAFTIGTNGDISLINSKEKKEAITLLAMYNNGLSCQDADNCEMKHICM